MEHHASYFLRWVANDFVFDNCHIFACSLQHRCESHTKKPAAIFLYVAVLPRWADIAFELLVSP